MIDFYYDIFNYDLKSHVDIKIKGKKIDFSYSYKFGKEGKYKIEYSFDYIPRTSYMFYNCKSLTRLDLSNFNSQNVSNIDHMFSGCESLISLDLSNFNIQNINGFLPIFKGCLSLKKENIITNDEKILKLIEFDKM